MRTLILGGGGIVGSAFAAEALARGWETRRLAKAELDIRDADAVAAVLSDFRPELVVNCAAFTQVDRCESEPDLARSVNGAAVGTLATAAARAAARFVHLSTDYVFDGESAVPYREDHPTAPKSVYGDSKLLGERLALEHEGSLVVRTSWIFGAGGPNFVDTIAGKLRAGERRLRIVADQLGAPTYAPFLASAMADLGECGASGLIHYQNRPTVTWHGLACEIAARVCPSGGVEVEPVTSADFPRPARRPAYSVLAVERFEKLLGRPVESWSEGLDRHLASA